MSNWVFPPAAEETLLSGLDLDPENVKNTTAEFLDRSLSKPITEGFGQSPLFLRDRISLKLDGQTTPARVVIRCLPCKQDVSDTDSESIEFDWSSCQYGTDESRPEIASMDAHMTNSSSSSSNTTNYFANMWAASATIRSESPSTALCLLDVPDQSNGSYYRTIAFPYINEWRKSGNHYIINLYSEEFPTGTQDDMRTTTPSSSQNKGGLPDRIRTPVIIVSVFVGLGLLALAAWLYVRHRRKRERRGTVVYTEDASKAGNSSTPA